MTFDHICQLEVQRLMWTPTLTSEKSLIHGSEKDRLLLMGKS